VAGGKARLGEALDAEERAVLILGLLERTLRVLRGWTPCTTVHVVTQDLRVAESVTRPAVSAVPQAAGGLNEGIALGIAEARDGGARSVLVLPADLPLLTIESLDRLLDAADAALAAGSGRPLVAIAPSDARNGTNALLLFPADVIAPAFGEHSFEAHVRAAAAVDATLQVVTDPALGFDLDTPEDVEMLAPDRLRELVREGHSALAGVEHDGRGAA
jgi:2-phospho-L-lactate guanylyltransferase